MPVAKTYQTWALVCEPYEKNKRMYVRARSPKGAEKEVRWYSEGEYARMYPDAAPTTSKWNGKKALGFTNGYITIFKGDLEAAEEWFRLSNCRFHVAWGWYVVSTEDIQADMPDCITPVRLDWERIVGHELDHTALAAIANEVLYGKSTSQWIGSVGERLTLTLTCISRSEYERGTYGTYYKHTFKDDDEHEFVWETAARVLEPNTRYVLRGTVKQHSTHNNVKQTILTRCIIAQ